MPFICQMLFLFGKFEVDVHVLTCKKTYSKKTLVAPWCSGYHYCTTSFNKAWTQVLHRFKSCSQRVGDSWWWGSLTMVLAGNKAKCLSLMNPTTKTIHHHHHHSQTCLYNHLYKITSCLRRPMLSPPKPIPIQLLLYKTTTCLTQSATTFFVPQMKKNLSKTTTV